MDSFAKLKITHLSSPDGTAIYSRDFQITTRCVERDKVKCIQHVADCKVHSPEHPSVSYRERSENVLSLGLRNGDSSAASEIRKQFSEVGHGVRKMTEKSEKSIKVNPFFLND